MKLLRLVAALLMFAIVSCNQKTSDDYKQVFSDPLLYSKTVKKLNDVVLENNFPPMIGSRNYAYANIAAYEAMVAGNSQFQSLSGQIRHLPAMPKPEAGKDKPAEEDLTQVDWASAL
jgi:hypothetical protein